MAKTVNQSAKTGKFVSDSYAKTHKATTIKHTVNSKKK